MTLNLRVDAAYGRLYVRGLDADRVAAGVPGAAFHDKRQAWMVSQTLPTLRRMREASGVPSGTFAGALAPDVLNWAVWAGAQQTRLAALHRRIADGWRDETFHWTDAHGHPVTREYRPPFEHQVVMASVANAMDGTAFLCEMGTGKTRAACEVIRAKLEGGAMHTVLVFCPRGVMKTWATQFAAWAPTIPVQVLTGLVSRRATRLAEAMRGPGGGVIVLNYDVASSMLKELEDALKAHPDRVGLVLDEAHRIRNPDTQTTKAMMRLTLYAGWRLAMTGTPILQGGHDIWSQWYFVDAGMTFGPSWPQFRDEFFVLNEYDLKLRPKNGALDEIAVRMQPRSLRYRKDDCLDLPPKLYETIHVEMTPAQRRAYREMEQQLVADLGGVGALDDTVIAANALTMILKLTQITSGHVKMPEGGVYRFEPNPKMRALVDWVAESLGDRKLIVWAWYKEDVRQLMHHLASYNPVRIVGGLTDRERGDAEDRFQTDPSVRVLVGNPASGGVGLNLQAASLAAYYSQGYSLDHRLQSEDRCHRSGSEIHDKVTYVDFVCEGTVDEDIVNAVLAKKSVAEFVVDMRRRLAGA